MIENNKLIMEFMEIKPKKGFSNKWHYADTPFISINDDSYEKVEETIAEYVKYNSSWDWLMPVYKKICNECGNYYPHDSEQLFSNLKSLRQWVRDVDIEYAYKYAVRCIEKLNEMKEV